VSSASRLVVFFLLATVFNILLMAILICVFFIIASLVPIPTLKLVVVIGGFIASIVLTFLAYTRAMKWVTVRFQLEKNIPQLFKNRRK
jgi:hypothetical protein